MSDSTLRWLRDEIERLRKMSDENRLSEFGRGRLDTFQRVYNKMTRK